MAEYYSDQITNENADPSVRNGANISGGRVRRKGFTYTVPVGGLAAADTIQLCKLHSGVRQFGGKLEHDAVGVATATLSIGDGSTADKYKTATAVDSAGGFTFGDTVALGFMDEVSGELVLTATVGTAGLTAGKVIRGFVEYMAD